MYAGIIECNKAVSSDVCR